MKKNLTTYYGLLIAAVLAQTIITVFSLSQNIGYGQKISFLENKSNTLQIQTNQLRTELAQKSAIRELEQRESNDFIAISEISLINRDSSSLALK
ncbi:MAG: hypothetical protein UT13_C0001G0537 [Candidatus Pacebacteria bacterium GW2011_GWF2_38_9]|nr:MAG: hypothetical protein US01_C0001G0550 [candidate division TM6 bacterium GW2011_GWF2_28_16]KKQ08419.1 MAG: hypothetical protein US20_C0017G0003 [Candidatus Pacebacteria bacterium GW2011_GWF1_36_5]KKQ88890.1 MAG: hypothetical protein UT13_C0001G0537 [Candidatus Pacebacteria bacterium GW2011_GWF2_38_9]MBU1033850.1 hypothetical protein [Patescibacteria group bacterium]HAZ73413.1 hypothetical protein [Candidatus Paceibacterota bacterium]